MADVPTRPYKEFCFLIAFKPTSMESRTEVTRWLKERDAIHVLADVWFLKAYYRFAGDILHELERFHRFDGDLIVLGLTQPVDRAGRGLSDEAVSWIKENLGP
jgi:hypothetical protein